MFTASECCVWPATEISGLWKYLLPLCAAPTHVQMDLGKNTYVNLNVSPIDAGGQKCTQGAPPVKPTSEMKKLRFEFRKQELCRHMWVTALRIVGLQTLLRGRK